MQTLPEYLTKRYLAWQADEGERKTLEDYAKYLGVNRSLLSYWMNGSRVPSDENVKKLAFKLGNDIYDILKIDRPNPYLQTLNRLWEHLPENIQKRLAEEAEIYETENETTRVQKVSERKKTAKNK